MTKFLAFRLYEEEEDEEIKLPIVAIDAVFIRAYNDKNDLNYLRALHNIHSISAIFEAENIDEALKFAKKIKKWEEKFEMRKTPKGFLKNLLKQKKHYKLN